MKIYFRVLLIVLLVIAFSFSLLGQTTTAKYDGTSCKSATASEAMCFNCCSGENNGCTASRITGADCDCANCPECTEVEDCGFRMNYYADKCENGKCLYKSECSKDADCTNTCYISGQVPICENSKCGCGFRSAGDCTGKGLMEAQSYCTNKNCKTTNWESINYCSCSDCETVADCTNKCPSTCPDDCHADPQTNTCVCNDTKPTDPTDPSTGGSVTIGPPFGASGPQSIGDLIKNITDWVLGLSGAVAVLFIIIAGFRYITAHGDSKQTEAAKTALRNAIVGLVIVILSFFIVRIIITVLSGQA